MPPRDKTLEEDASSSTSPLLSHKQSSSSTSTLEQLMQESQRKAKLHNGPIRPEGWRRTSFHIELNLLTFGFWFLAYHYCCTEKKTWFHIGAALVALDAARYYSKRADLPGAPYTLPFVSLVAMVIFPVRFWAELAIWATESDVGMCTTLLGGNFMVFVTDTKLCRQILTGEGTFQIYAHPNALWLFGPKNLIYMPKETHKAFRAILTPALFSKEALVSYAQYQEVICRRFLHKYKDYCATHKQPIDARIAFRSMAAASSQEAFLGPFLNDTLREQLEQDIVTFTMGFLSFPIPYIGGLRRAIQAKNRIEAEIRAMVPKSHAYMQNPDHEPRCLMDRWCRSIQETAQQRGVKVEEVPYCEDDNVARTVLDFLFAAQDATNSALAYALDVLDEDRFVWTKMRQEIDTVCPNKAEVWTKMADTQETLHYTSKVGNQLLHHKPPVPMIPHLVKKQTTLAGRHIPKGTVVIPSLTYSARTSGASVEFQPERPDADPMFVSTVTFGAGQHKCPGRRYAESLLTVFLAVLAQEFDFHRSTERPQADEYVYFPTLFPKDCQFMVQARVE